MAEQRLLENDNNNGKCCQLVKVESNDRSYAGVYRLLQTDDKTKQPKLNVNGHVEYVKNSKSDSTQKFTIKFGRFSVHGKGWYILKNGGGLSWQLKDSKCLSLGDWKGNGAVLSCVTGV